MFGGLTSGGVTAEFWLHSEMKGFLPPISEEEILLSFLYVSLAVVLPNVLLFSFEYVNNSKYFDDTEH